MNDHLKQFATHSAYEAVKNNLDTPNVVLCTQEDEVHYNPYIDNRLIATFNITDTSSATPIMLSSATSQFSKIEIDGVVLPNIISSYTFNTIGEHTVKYTLSDSTSIGSSVFQDCTGLTSVTIPSSVISIEGGAFRYCYGLASIIIPNSVTTIGDYAFSGCTGLTLVTISNSVTTIANGVFSSCRNLASVTIGNSVNSIGEYAFRGCSGLTSIVCSATTAPTISSDTFQNIKTGGALTVPVGSTGYNTWMGTGNYYLGKYNWTKVTNNNLI